MTGRRLYPAQWQLAVETLTAVLTEGRAADRMLQAAFKDRRQMGGKDRRRVTDLVYGVLRDRRRLCHVAGNGEASALCAVHALDAGLTDVQTLERFGVGEAPALAVRLAAQVDADLSPAERGNVPDDIHGRWLDQYGAEQTAALAAALMQQAPVDLRVNSLLGDREGVLAELAAASIDAAPTPLAPLGIRLAGRAPLRNLDVYRAGRVEPQDEGSQLLSLLLAVRPGEAVADFCAGAGGKTLAMAAQMRNRGRVLACDIDAHRLQRLSPRLQRAGVECVQLHPLPEASGVGADADMHGQFDAVFVDAPCSGTGTWRRQPEARLKSLDLDALSALQTSILARAARWVRPGGRLVYATCSLLREENDAVVDAFMATSTTFERDDAGAILREQSVELPGRELRLFPHRHGTDGFYGACLRRLR